MSGDAQDGLERLAAMDAELALVDRLSLDPGRARARSLHAIGHHLFSSFALAPGVAAALAEGLSATAAAIRTHFPGNLLWDLDHLAASVLREALRAPAPAAHVRESFAEIVGLHAMFGHGTTLRFRYAHDFVYGFDWAKWVCRDPSARRGVGPFDLAFLRAMRARGGELLALIEAGKDETYPPLRGDRHRNPFAFSREPNDELTLYRDLAARELIPVRAWTFDAPPVWDRGFAEERERRARALGIHAR